MPSWSRVPFNNRVRVGQTFPQDFPASACSTFGGFHGSLTPTMALTLYHVEWCPDCIAVRETLSRLGAAYTGVIVPDARPLRKQVYDVSGQYFVPVLTDGDTVLTETDDIVAHLETHYAKTPS